MARQLKWEPGLERTCIIVITGEPLPEVGQKAIWSGCEAIFSKPMDPAKLEALLAMP